MTLQIQDMSAHNGTVCANIRIYGDTQRCDERTAEALLHMRPSLAKHTCKSKNGITTFDKVIRGASLPHVVEHVAIDIMVQKRSQHGASGPIAGNTKSVGVPTDGSRFPIMQVRITQTPDTVYAIEEAVRIINTLVK